MKVLLVHNYYRRGTPGGEDIVFDSERQLLERAGHSVETYLRFNDDFDESKWSDRFKVARGFVYSSKVTQDILRVIAKKRPDVAHFHNTFPLIGSSGYLACRRMGVPIVQTVHNYRITCASATHFRNGAVCELCASSSPWAAVLHKCYRQSRAASLLVAHMMISNFKEVIRNDVINQYLALTEFSRDRLITAGVRPERVTVKPNFIDAFTVAEAKTLRASRAQPYVVFSGRLSEEKGLRVLISAWQAVPDVPLLIIGDGPLRNELQNFVYKNSLNVSFLGMLPRQKALKTVAAASCLIAPSLWFEGMPMVILEAWALGVPVVGSRIGGIAELLGEGQRGLLFDVGDHRDLTRQVRSMLYDAHLREKLVAEGLEAAKAANSSRALRQLEDIYDAVARDHATCAG